MSSARVTAAVSITAKGQKQAAGSARVEIKIADLERALSKRTTEAKGPGNGAQ